MLSFKKNKLPMKKTLIILSLLTFTSCGTMTYFAKINGINALEETYINKSDTPYDVSSILQCFCVKDSTYFVSITAENPNEIKLTYHSESDSTEHELIFAGKMKKKYLEMSFIEGYSVDFLLENSYPSDIHNRRSQIRIGKSKDEKLLIRQFYKNTKYKGTTLYKFAHEATPIEEINTPFGSSEIINEIKINSQCDTLSLSK
jgi:hypothetical protein